MAVYKFYPDNCSFLESYNTKNKRNLACSFKYIIQMYLDYLSHVWIIKFQTHYF